MYLPKDKIRPIFILTIISTIIGIIIVIYTDFPVLAVLAGILAIFFVYFSASVNRFKKRIIKSLAILNDYCDPKAFMNEIDKLISVCSNKKQKIQLQINKSAGLYWNGDFNKCIKLLKSIEEKNIYNNMLLAIYHLNIASCMVALGDFDGADSELNKIDNLKQNKKSSEAISKAKEQIKYNMKLSQGNFDGAEKYYKRMYEKSINKIDKCFAKYSLVKIYTNENDIDEAKLALKYVADYASKLYFYKSAKEMYNKIK